MIEVLEREDMAQFEREGGPMAVIIAAAVFAARWVVIGFLVHVGWRLVG